MACRNYFGGHKGPNPEMIRWIYTAIIRPIIMYGNLIWSRVISTQSFKLESKKIHRMVCLLMSHCRKSTPTDAMEVFNYLLPLDIEVKKDIAGQITKTHLPVLFNGETFGLKYHITIANKCLGDLGFENKGWDRIPTEIFRVKKFFVENPSEAKGLDTQSRDDIRVYTDGSKQEDKAGGGFVVFDGDTIVGAGNAFLGIETTV